MESARKPEEDSSSEERDPLRRAQKEPTFQRNGEPDVEICSKLRPYQTRRHQKEQSMFKHGKTSNEKPAIINSQTTTSSKSPASILKNKSSLREVSRLYDEQLPILISPSPAPQTSGYKRYQDDAVTSKTPDTSEGESSINDEAMQSDTESDEREAVEFTRADRSLKTNRTKKEKGEVVEFTPTDLNPKGKSTLQKSKSLELKSSQAGRALGTFKAFNFQELKDKQKPAPSPKNAGKGTEEATQKGLEKKRGRPRKRADLAAVTNLDADKAIAAEKPLTLSRENSTSSLSQATSVKPTSTSTSRDQLIMNTQVGNGSSLTIVRKHHD